MRRINAASSSGRAAVNNIRELQDPDLDSVTGGTNEIIRMIEWYRRQAVINALWKAARGGDGLPPGSQNPLEGGLPNPA
jgi:hypothetical protein